MSLDAATFLLQWSAGGLLFGWVTTRRREVSAGYGWLLRIVFGFLALAAAVIFAAGENATWRAVAAATAALTAAAAAVALVSSVSRRGAGVRGRREARARRRARVAAMTGRRRVAEQGSEATGRAAPEFVPLLDLPAPLLGAAGLLAAAAAGGPWVLNAARLLSGAAFLGAVTDAMLLGHWYLVQPGLGRSPLRELVRWTAWLWPVEVALLLLPTGMVSVFSGAVDDGYGGLLGWVWAVSAGATIALAGATWLALRERSYAALMAATGLLYLAILTAFGTDLVARAVLAP